MFNILVEYILDNIKTTQYTITYLITHPNQGHRLRTHGCATRGISCLAWMAWVRHTHAHFCQVHMRDFIKN